MPDSLLIRVTAPHFVAGLLTDGTVTSAAPILKYMVGWDEHRAAAYIKRKGWKAEACEGQPVPFRSPRVHNIYHKTAPPGAVFCGRGSPYGNPFPITAAQDRDTVCDRFEAEVLPGLDVSALRGLDLVCYCKPKRCHCDAIMVNANK